MALPASDYACDRGAYSVHHRLALQIGLHWKARLRGYIGSTGHMMHCTVADGVFLFSVFENSI